MSNITKRQTYWRYHVLAAAAFEGTIVEYATLHNLQTKDIYQWKIALTKRGFLPMKESQTEADFVTVISFRMCGTPSEVVFDLRLFDTPIYSIPTSNSYQCC